MIRNHVNAGQPMPAQSQNELVGRPMQILIVEDNLIDVRLTAAALKRSNIQHNLTIVFDGQQAMEFLCRKGIFARAPRPDLILLDLYLPKKNGREVLVELRSDPDLCAIPVVVMTASTNQQDLADVKRLRVESYITKPVNLAKFLEVVRQLKRFWLADVILPSP